MKRCGGLLDHVWFVFSSFCIEFISRGRFLREEISLLRLFALAMLKGDAPPDDDDDDDDYD